MIKSFDGLWQLDLLNGAPEPENNQFTLVEGVLVTPETGTLSGTYEVTADHLILMVPMAAVPGESAWSLRVRLASQGPLGKDHMLGEVEVVFAEGEPIPYSECAFYRLQES